MKKYAASAVVILFAIFASSVSVRAEQYVRKVHGKEVVVHTNPVPVVLHRLVPPYLGKHVTARQLQTGRMPIGFGK